MDQNGVEKPITNGNLDSQPSLSLDKRQIVFVRKTPGEMAETGAGDVEKTELWIAYVDGITLPKRILTGGEFIEGPNANIVVAGFAGPQFSPNGTRIYFTAMAYATQGAVLALDLATGKTTFLFPGLGKEVITTGKYQGFLIGLKFSLEQFGRVMVYWLLDSNGNEVMRIGENEPDLVRFKRKYDIH